MWIKKDKKIKVDRKIYTLYTKYQFGQENTCECKD